MIGNDWDNILKDEIKKRYFKELIIYLNNENKTKIIYPEKDNLFRALKLTPYKDVNVVILGQDPYHGEREANGLCFSVNKGVKIPPSLQNIFKELKSDLHINRTNTDLTDWAEQGILLLNTILTVEKDKPASHKNLGWETFTDAIISKVNEKDTPVVFILWGNFDKRKKSLITNPKHLIIESSHPSPFSCNYGFFGSRPFSRTNKFLKENNIKEIDFTVK